MHNYKLFNTILFFKFLSIFSSQLYSSNEEISQARAKPCFFVACSNLKNCTYCKNCDCFIQQQDARTRYGICSLGCHAGKECVCFMHNNENQIEQRTSKLDDVCLSLQSLCCYNCITLGTCNKSENCISCFCDPLCSDNNEKLLCAGTLENSCELSCEENDLCSLNLCNKFLCCFCENSIAKIKPVDPFKLEMK